MYDIESFTFDEYVEKKMSNKDKECFDNLYGKFMDDEYNFINERKDDVKLLLYNNSKKK